LRAVDAPPQLKFPSDTDLFQLFWNPRFEDKKPRREMGLDVAWHRAAGLKPHEAPAITGNVWPGYVPVPCRVAPERVLELPSWEVLPQVMKDQLTKIPDIEKLYRDEWSIAPGTKVGGYSPVSTPPACTSCRWGMDYLLTIAEREWPTGSRRWQPTEDSQDLQSHAADLHLGPSTAVHVYQCLRCETRPTAAVV
jgi:hypothetical protein